MSRTRAEQFMVLLLTLTRAFAADLVVDPGDPGAYGSIGSAIAAASSGDRVLVAPGSYDEVVDPAGRDVHIEATGGAAVTSIGGARFVSGEGVGAALVGFTVSRAGSSAIEIIGASPTLSDLVVTGSGGPEAQGGGVSVSGASAPTLERVQFVANQGLEGGDLYVGVGASASVSASNFDGSSADRGGAVFVREGSIDLDDSAIVGARAVYEGGALYATYATVTWAGTSATGSRVDAGDGGAVWIEHGALTVSGATFDDNAGIDGVSGGGAIFASASEVTITSSVFVGNEHGYGGSLSAADGSVVRADDTTFDRGVADVGGAISVVRSALETSRCVFVDGVGRDLGGAIYGYDASWTDAESELVHNLNAGVGDGGAVAIELFGAVTLVGTLFTRNESGSVGGVMFADQGDQLVLDGVVIDQNVGSVGVVYASSVAEVIVRGVRATFNEGTVLYGFGGVSVAVEGSTFADNSGTYQTIISTAELLTVSDTGFIHNAQPLVNADAAVLTDSVFNFNTVDASVPMVDLGGEASVERCGFEGNDAWSVLELNGTATVVDTEFARNVAVTATLATEAQVTVLRSSFVQNYGGVRHLVVDELAVVDCEFVENIASAGGSEGGAIFADGRLSVTGSTFTRNEGTGGGAIRVGELGVGDDFYIADSVFEGNRANGAGGAILLDGGSLVVEGGWFGGNSARYGGAIASLTLVYTTLELNASWVVGNEAELGGGAYLNAVDSSLTNNTWVGNAATISGGHVWARSVEGASTNEVYAYAPSGGGLWFDGQGESLVATYGVWHGNVPVDLTQTSPLDVVGGVGVFEPGFALWSDDGDFSNDDLTPGAGSPLIDAGDPSLWDVDGSRSDIGATGGPYVGPPDQDGDGFAASDGDCDDADPTVFPGADDPTDGVDADCDGFDERDQDGDGFVSVVFGGPDCDDTDGTVLPGARELCDGVDEDCDGVVDDGAADGSDWFADADGDGFTDPAARAWACEAPAGFYAASVPPDCDDTDAAVFPGADDPSEDGVDQDCDGRDTPAAADTKRVLAPAATGCAQGPPGAPWWAAAAAGLLARARSARCPTRRAGA